jgi:type I restriction enzyme S subunit
MPYIGLEHIEEGTLRLLKLGTSTDVISAKSRFESGDILFGKLRPYFRKVLRPHFSGVCSTDIFVVRAKQDIDQGYLFYWMASQEFVDAATRASEGTKMPRAKWDFLERIEKPVPPLSEQRAIAHILGTLDDKIELNRRMNQTLEAMAQALFKNWFVDFAPFRDQDMQDSPLGEIPVGWEVRKLSEVLQLSYGKGLREHNRQPGGVPVYGSNGQVGWHNMALARGPGIIIGRKGNPGTVTWAPTDFFPIDTTFFVEPIGQIRSMAYLFHALRSLDLSSLSADSAVPGLNRNMAYMSDILVPPASILLEFDGHTNALMHKVHANDKESQMLSDIRDALLPKLLSGEIRVKDAEKFVEKAI